MSETRRRWAIGLPLAFLAVQAAALLEAAGKALYEAKCAGRNQVKAANA